jgi:deoxyribonuclease V
VLSFPELQLVDGVVVESRVAFRYIPGLLSFRETPPLLKAFDQLQTEPDLIIADGQGIAHPRRFGIASHLGLILDKPTIGCAKSRLWGRHKAPKNEEGSFEYLRDKDEVIGAAVRTRTDVSIVYVSIGHRITLRSAIKLTLMCCKKYRLPETTRYAHNAAGGKIAVPQRSVAARPDQK